MQEIGGLVGRTLLAVLAVYIVSRRKLIRMFQIPGLIIMPIVFAYVATRDLQWLYFGIFFAGLFTVGQFSFWGNYLPRVYPVHLRGTGESFAANIGGRLIGTSFAWLTATLAVTPDRANAPAKVAMVAAAVGFSVYLVGLIASFWLEPERDEADPAEVARHAVTDSGARTRESHQRQPEETVHHRGSENQRNQYGPEVTSGNRPTLFSLILCSLWQRFLSSRNQPVCRTEKIIVGLLQLAASGPP